MVRRLIDRFYARLREAVAPLTPDSLLDAGCGEGETLARLADLLPERVAAIDLSEEAAGFAARRLPAAEVLAGSVYELPFDASSFDLVLCLEVFEHLREPATALEELARVSRGDVIVSTPHEPWFQLGSLARGKYLAQLGNHPEHVNHWNRRSLPRLLAEHFEEVTLRGSAPWLIAHCRRR